MVNKTFGCFLHVYVYVVFCVFDMLQVFSAEKYVLKQLPPVSYITIKSTAIL